MPLGLLLVAAVALVAANKPIHNLQQQLSPFEPDALPQSTNIEFALEEVQAATKVGGGTVSTAIGFCIQIDLEFSPVVTVQFGAGGTVEVATNGDISINLMLAGGVSFNVAVFKASFFGQGDLKITATIPRGSTAQQGVIGAIKTWFASNIKKRSNVKNIQKLVGYREESEKAFKSALGCDSDEDDIDCVGNDEIADFGTQIMQEGFISMNTNFVKSLVDAPTTAKANAAAWLRHVELEFRANFLMEGAKARNDWKNVGANPKCTAKGTGGVTLTPVARIMCRIFKTGYFLDSGAKKDYFRAGSGANFALMLPIMFPELFNKAPAATVAWLRTLNIQMDAGIFDDLSDWDIQTIFAGLSFEPSKLQKLLEAVDGVNCDSLVTISKVEFTGQLGFTIGKDEAGFCTPDTNPFQVNFARSWEWTQVNGQLARTGGSRTLTITIAGTTYFWIVLTLDRAAGYKFAELVLKLRLPFSSDDEYPTDYDWKAVVEKVEAHKATLPTSNPRGFEVFQTWMGDLFMGVQEVLPGPASMGGAMGRRLQEAALNIGRSLMGSVSPVDLSFTTSALVGVDISVDKNKNIGFKLVSETVKGASVKFPTPSGITLKFQGYYTESIIVDVVQGIKTAAAGVNSLRDAVSQGR